MIRKLLRCGYDFKKEASPVGESIKLKKKVAAAVALSKSERIEIILTKLGRGDLDLDQYRALMKEQGLTEADVDEWCADYHAFLGIPRSRA
jgi:hypothetical protein